MASNLTTLLKLVIVFGIVITTQLLPSIAAATDQKMSTSQLGSPGKLWLPSKSTSLRGVLICLHGFGLNASSFEAFGKDAAERGFACFAPDIRGFGYWRASGTHPKLDLAVSVEDVRSIVKALKANHPDMPVFVLGESMGGAIAITAASLYPDGIDGLIASVPSAERFEQKKASAVVAFRYLLDADKEIDVKHKVVDRAIADEELKRMWLLDPRNRIHVSPRELLQFQRFMNAATDRAKEIRQTPVLIVQGCRDNLVKPDATVNLYKRVASSDKQLLMVGQAEHLIFQKGQFTNQTMEMLMAWLRQHENVVVKQQPINRK